MTLRSSCRRNRRAARGPGPNQGAGPVRRPFPGWHAAKSVFDRDRARQQEQLKDVDRERRDFASRTLVVFFLVAVMCSVLIARMVWLTVFKHDEYRTISEDNRIQMYGVPPPRGRIYDRAGNLLADNVPVFSIFVIPELAGDVEATLAEIGALVELSNEGDRGVSHVGERELPALADPGQAAHIAPGTCRCRSQPPPSRWRPRQAGHRSALSLRRRLGPRGGIRSAQDRRGHTAPGPASLQSHPVHRKAWRGSLLRALAARRARLAAGRGRCPRSGTTRT